MKKNYDIEEMIQWLEKEMNNVKTRSMEVGVVGYLKNELPTIAKLLTFDQKTIDTLPEEKKKEYRNFIKSNTAAISSVTALGLGTSFLGTIGLTSSSVGAFSAIGGFGAVGGAIGLGFVPFGLPFLLGVAGYSFAIKKTKSLINHKQNKEEKNKLDDILSSCDKKMEFVNKELEKKINELNELMSTNIKQTMEFAKKESKKIAILIDDALHSDENIRIGMYHEIVIKQYKKQAQMETTLNDINLKYNELKKENGRLVKELDQYNAIKRNVELTKDFII